MSLSLCLATYNEEANLSGCLESARTIADEIIVVDGTSTDNTVKIAKSFGAKVIVTSNPAMFHINKQKALLAASGDWILQLDADERVTPELTEEIKKVIRMSEKEIEEYEKNLPEKKLFERHQQIISKQIVISTEANAMSEVEKSFKTKDPSTLARDDKKEAQYDKQINAFFIPRLNFFLGKYLRHGGVYPDGVIRLFKKGKAYLPCNNVHELMEVEGHISWLQNPILHYCDKDFSRYIKRWEKYNDLDAKNLSIQVKNKKLNSVLLFFEYCFWKPVKTFFMMYFRHKGFMDGGAGLIFSFFSSIRFIVIYWKFVKA